MSTTLTEANEALLQRFEAVWIPTGHSFTFENETYDPPTDQPWARFSVRHAESKPETLGPVGARKFERRGSAYAQIFTLEGTGTKLSKELCDVVLAGFEGTRIAGTTIRFADVIPREVGPTGRWYQANVEIQFIYTEIK